MEPKINLAYNSQGAEGIAGFGWSLSASSAISRQGKRQYYNGSNSPVNFTNNNDAFLLDGQHLFPVTGNNGDNGTVYGTENESFSKIESFGGSATYGPDRFKVTTRDGVILDYGSDATSKVLTDNGQSVMLWLLKKVTDKSGNYQEYKYSISQTDRDFVLTEIDYTGNSNTGQLPYNKVEFVYTVLPNWQNRKIFEGGSKFTSPFLLDKINIKNIDGTIVKKYQCNYTVKKNQSFLSSFSETGSDGTVLNPLTFQYGSNPNASDVNVSPSYPGFDGNNAFTGELTGDGKQDVLAARYSLDNNNIPHYTAYDVIDDFTVYAGSPGLSLAYTYPIPEPPGTAIDLQGLNFAPPQPYVAPNKDYKTFILNDYDGDGKSDVLMVSNTISLNRRTFNGIKINYSRNYNGWLSTYQTVDYPQMPHAWSSDDWKYICETGSYIVQGDFDGDGAQDYILILGPTTYVTNYLGFFSSPAKNIINKEIQSFGVGGNLNDAYSIASSTSIIPIDFDGDGKQEILVVKPNASYILSISKISTDYSYQSSILYTFSNLLEGYKIFPGDFNGDGKTDLLVRTSASNSSAAWNILYSTGKEYKSYPFIFQNKPYLDGDNGGSAHHLMVADLNNDGKTDIWHSLDVSASSSKHTAYISNGVPLDNTNSLSAFSIFNYSANTSINRNQTVQSVFGDFNFDGKPDIFSITGTTAKIIYVKPDKEENLMVQSTNGLGAVSNFSYQKGYNRSSVYDYDNISVPLGQGVNGNPYTVLKTPMYVLNTLTEPNGTGAYKYTYMQYEDAMYHSLRGFLGFKKVTATDGFTGTGSTTYSEMNVNFLTPYVYKTTTGQYGNLLTETDIDNNLLKVNQNNYYDKRFMNQVFKSTTFNFMTGSGSETNNTYGSYGNITSSTAKVGPFSGTTITALETITSTISYINGYKTPVPLPSGTTITKTRTGQPAVNKTTTYSYNANDLTASVIDFSGTSIASTLSYTYDIFGNIISQNLTAAGGPPTPTVANTYDSKGRFLLSKSTSGSGITKTETFVYNSLNDNVSGATSSDGLTTTFNYDGFGRLIKTNLPDGNSMVNSLAWESSTGRFSQTVYRYSDNGLWGKTYFDIIGRDIRKESKGFNNQLIFSTTQYNQQGLVYKQAQPRYSTEPSVEVTNSYDQLQRLTSVTNGSTTNTYSYSLVSGGLFTTTSTNGSGQSTSKTTDASGKTVKTNDNGGLLNFTYDSWGNQKEVKFESVISLIVSVYDSYGRQTSLTDKNAGTITYEYNSLGKLTKQTDAKNNIQTFIYDGFGRIVSKTSAAGTTSYTYYSVAGKVNDNITLITGFAGDIKTFQYDNLQRPLSETTSFDGGSLTKSFQYDSKGNLIKTTYSSGLSINDTYDNNNILTLTSMTYAGVTKTLFTASAMNSRGIYTGYSYGNGKSSTLTYDLVKGVPTRYYTSGIQDLNFNFDANTGNLLSRNEAIKGVTETFTYDNLNRLTAASVNNVQQFTMAYDGATNNSLGNIKNKSDIGNYRYDAQKINQVRFITTNSGTPTNPPNVISVNTQAITYTPFLKTATVSENGYQIAYTYGHDEQRIKSVLKQGASTLETKYYVGSYERQIKPGVDREIHYISAGNGLCAIVVVQGGVATTYFVYSDHLGSLLTLTSSTGAIVAEQNFGAWGRHRNPANWTYNSIPARPDWLYRGFTAHEDVSQFALINMNGRMYDPVTCRMLSPDNYVPLPWNTQGYNRYGYANNNPLIYKDADGNFFFLIPILVGAFVGAATSAAIYSVSAGSSFTWSGFTKSAGIGAVAGGVGGGLGLLAKSLGAFGQSTTYGIVQNVATQIAVDAAFGYKITLGTAAGAALGGIIDGAIPKFKGIKFDEYNLGAAVANAVAELAVNTARGAVIGGISSVIGGGSFEDGARSGAVGGLVRTGFNIAILGPTIRPTGDIRLALDKQEKDLKIDLTGAYGPTYRAGGLWRRGLTLNGFSMINNNGEGVNDVHTWVHESYHFYQLITQSWAGQFTHGIYEQWWLAPFKGIKVYDYRTYGTYYNESAAEYYFNKIYPGL